MKTELLIRNIQYDDIKQVVDIRINAWKIAYKGIIDDEFLDNMSREKDIERRKNDYQLGHFIVAQANDEIVGFCRYGEVVSDNSKEYNGEIVAIYVKPECKYGGIGTQMFTYAVNHLKKENKDKIIIWCLRDNLPSRKFYEKMGGRVSKEKDTNIDGKLYPEVGFEYII